MRVCGVAGVWVGNKADGQRGVVGWVGLRHKMGILAQIHMGSPTWGLEGVLEEALGRGWRSPYRIVT